MKAKKKQIVYKVVCVEPGGKLTSTFAPKEFRREYRQGQTTRPLRGTGLFAFLTKRDAQLYNWTKWDSQTEIWKAEATGVSPARVWLDYHESKDRLLCFFQKAFQSFYSSQFPSQFPSSRSFKSITLLKRV